MAIIGHGTTVKFGSAPTTLAGVLSVSFGSDKVDTHDITQMADAGNKRSFIAGLEDEGDVSIKMNVIPGDTSQTAFGAAKGAAVAIPIIVTYPGGVRIRTLSGIITSIDEDIPDDKPATKTAKIKITGDVVDSVSSGS